MRSFMEAQEFNFTDALRKMLGISEEDVNGIMERLGVDEMTDLVDACVKGDKDRVREIIGAEKMEGNDTDPAEEPKDAPKKDEEPEIGSLLLPKDKAKKLKAKKRELKRREDEKHGEDDTATTFKIGDPVWVHDEEGTVKIPTAPGDTVGVMINGELKMVDKSKVEKLEEGVLGLTPMPGLQRMMELAGLPSAMGHAPPALDFDEPAPSVPATPVMDVVDEPANDEFGGDEFGGDEFGGDDMGADLGAGLGDDMGGDMGGDMGDAAPVVTPALSTPALPAPTSPTPAPVPAGGMGGIPALGSALEDAAALDHAISEIENLIPAVKISDFKQVVARLEALVAMAKGAGKAALAEGKEWMPSDHAEWEEERRERNRPSPYLDYDYRANPSADEDEDEVEEDIVKAPGAKKVPTAQDGDEVTRKTLMDYVREQEEQEVELGASQADATKTLQARMGKDTTPAQATQTLNKLRGKGLVKNQNGKTVMDSDVAAAISDPDADQM